MTQKYSLTVESRLERLSEIAEFAQAAARDSGLNEDQVYEVQMAIDEACANVIEHAYRGRPDGTLRIECEKRGKEFVVTIQDSGARFDPRKVERPRTRDPLSKRNIGGLGLFFMRKMMDKVEFDFSTRHGNRLTMVKKIKR
ncbi:MAG: ATP-binding protein [Chloroflexota bacterium]|nr:ATP-binding protein [Chloroflexota bacterium]